MSLVLAAAPLWRRHGPAAEAWAWCEATLRVCPPGPLRARLAVAQAYLGWQTPHSEQALARADEGLALLAGPDGDPVLGGDGVLLAGMFNVEPSVFRYAFGGDETVHVLDGEVEVALTTEPSPSKWNAPIGGRTPCRRRAGRRRRRRPSSS